MMVVEMHTCSLDCGAVIVITITIIIIIFIIVNIAQIIMIIVKIMAVDKGYSQGDEDAH
jgi:hypothetical protein